MLYTDDYINEHYPNHARTSCRDSAPDINATPDGHGCVRCNALLFQREEWQQAVVVAAQSLVAQQAPLNPESAYRQLVGVLASRPGGSHGH